MLHVTASPTNPSSFTIRKGTQASSGAKLSNNMAQPESFMASAVLIVPVYDEKHQGADLLMMPIFNPDDERHAPPAAPAAATTRATTAHTSGTQTPGAPTPPPKPQLPHGCQDWDHYLSQKKSNVTLLPLCYNPEEEAQKRIRSPELNFHHGFEDMGWRDCLSQRQKRGGPPEGLRRRPSAATSATSATSTTTIGCGGASLRSLPLDDNRRLSNASTLTTNTTSATAPMILGSSSMSIRSKRLSNASTLTTSTFGSVKPRGLRRICRSRHLRSYYSEGTSLFRARMGAATAVTKATTITAAAAAAATGSGGQWRAAMEGIMERYEPVERRRRRRQQQQQLLSGTSILQEKSSRRLSTLSIPVSLTEYSAPPPYPPPEKPLPSLPMKEVRELQTREGTRWRELLLRSFQRMDTGRRRIQIR